MSEDIKLVWLSVRDDHTRKVNADEGLGYDGKVPVGRVSLASGDPTNRGAWRWQMFGYSGSARSPAALKRTGSAHSKEDAKAHCERAYAELLAAYPGNRQAIHEHHASVEESAQLQQSGAGVARAREQQPTSDP